VDAIEQVLLRISRLVEEVHEIRELDLNPIFALPHCRCPHQGLVHSASLRVVVVDVLST
jgi:hypothetical protein